MPTPSVPADFADKVTGKRAWAWGLSIFFSSFGPSIRPTAPAGDKAGVPRPFGYWLQWVGVEESQGWLRLTSSGGRMVRAKARQGQGQHEAVERILESDRPGSQSQLPYGVALLLGQITEPFALLSLQMSRGQHKSSSGGANEIRDGTLVTSCHTSARKVPVTSQVTQSKGSCQDCQNLASPRLPSCFLSPSHSAPTVLVSLLPFNTRHISTPGLCTAVHPASAALPLYIRTAVSLPHSPVAQLSPSR